MVDKSTLFTTTATLAKAYVAQLNIVNAPEDFQNLSVDDPNSLLPFGKSVLSTILSSAPSTVGEFASVGIDHDDRDDVVRGVVPMAQPDGALDFTDASSRVFVVGSQIVSFDDSVTPDRREAAVNSCLLAQLHASQVCPNPTTVAAAFEWHAAYVNTLTNIGWVLQSGVTVKQSVAMDGAQVDKALLDLITSLLPGAAAATLVTKVLSSLASLNKGDPLLTLYTSKVVEQDIIEFGASLGSSPSTGFLVSVVECAVSVSTIHREAIFFKWDASRSDVEGRRYDLSLSDSIYGAVKDQIADRIKPFVKNYVAMLELVHN